MGQSGITLLPVASSGGFGWLAWRKLSILPRLQREPCRDQLLRDGRRQPDAAATARELPRPLRPWTPQQGLPRAELALQREPQVVSTACPHCAVMIGDGLKALGCDEQVLNRDLAELLAEAPAAEPAPK